MSKKRENVFTKGGELILKNYGPDIWEQAKNFGYPTELILKMGLEPYVWIGNNHYNHRFRGPNTVTFDDREKSKNLYLVIKREIEEIYNGDVVVLGAVKDDNDRYRFLVEYKPMGHVTTVRRDHLLKGQKFWLNEERNRRRIEKEIENALADQDIAKELDYDFVVLKQKRYARLFVRFGQTELDFNLTRCKEEYSVRVDKICKWVGEHERWRKVKVAGAVYKATSKQKSNKSSKTYTTHYYYVLVLYPKNGRKNSTVIDVRDDRLQYDKFKKILDNHDKKKKVRRSFKCNPLSPEELLKELKKEYGHKWGDIVEIREAGMNEHSQRLVQCRHIAHGWLNIQTYNNVKNGILPSDLKAKVKNNNKLIEIHEHVNRVWKGDLHITGILKTGSEGSGKNYPNRPYVKFQCPVHPSEVKRIAVKQVPSRRVFCNQCKVHGAKYTIIGALMRRYVGESGNIYIAKEISNLEKNPWINVGVTIKDYKIRYSYGGNKNILTESITEYEIVDLNLAVLIELAIHSSPALNMDRLTLCKELTKRNGRSKECYNYRAAEKIVELLHLYIKNPLKIIEVPEIKKNFDSEKMTSEQKVELKEYLSSFKAPRWRGGTTRLPESVLAIR